MIKEKSVMPGNAHGGTTIKIRKRVAVEQAQS